jgi:hypothetical protein
MDTALPVRRQVQQPDNDFVYPPPSGENGPNNTVLSVGSTIELKWQTTLDFYDLMLYQQFPRTAEFCADISSGCVSQEYIIASQSPFFFSQQPLTSLREYKYEIIHMDCNYRFSGHVSCQDIFPHYPPEFG